MIGIITRTEDLEARRLFFFWSVMDLKTKKNIIMLESHRPGLFLSIKWIFLVAVKIAVEDLKKLE